jgi:hypothetical protein
MLGQDRHYCVECFLVHAARRVSYLTNKFSCYQVGQGELLTVDGIGIRLVAIRIAEMNSILTTGPCNDDTDTWMPAATRSEMRLSTSAWLTSLPTPSVPNALST